MEILTKETLTELNLGLQFFAGQELREYLTNTFDCRGSLVIELVGLPKAQTTKTIKTGHNQTIKVNGDFYELVEKQEIQVIIPASPLRLKVFQSRKNKVRTSLIVSLNQAEIENYLGHKEPTNIKYTKELNDWMEYDKLGMFGRIWNETKGVFEELK